MGTVITYRIVPVGATLELRKIQSDPIHHDPVMRTRPRSASLGVLYARIKMDDLIRIVEEFEKPIHVRQERVELDKQLMAWYECEEFLRNNWTEAVIARMEDPSLLSQKDARFGHIVEDWKALWNDANKPAFTKQKLT